MQKPVVMKIKLSGGTNSIIPKGQIENLVIEVIDGGATFRFVDSKTTRMLAIKQAKDGIQSQYSERLQKTIVKYPGMNQVQIVAHIKDMLKAMGAKL